MLHKNSEVILPETLALLENLQSDSALADFFLAGGTALALQIGHRFSIDLDFFTCSSFKCQTLEEHLTTTYGLQVDHVTDSALLGVVQSVKTDFIRHAYPLVRPLLKIEKIRLASLEDISAMKLNAISHSGQRYKDFVDIYFLLEKIPLNVMLSAYEIKYANSNAIIALKSLVYFDGIDFHQDQPKINRKVSFPDIKARLIAAVAQPNKLF